MFAKCMSLVLILALLTPPGFCACATTSAVPAGHTEEGEHDRQCPDHPESAGGQEPCPLPCPSDDHEPHAPGCPAVKSAAAPNTATAAPTAPPFSGMGCSPRVPNIASLGGLAVAANSFLGFAEQPLYLTLRALLI
ncbi:MAG: hypothetical protein L0Z62_04510 [Gemmataceae bacterium]|nr:hypothetical protein [Gemmataceae bacterium]